MSRNLHVGTVYQIKYGYPGLWGCDGQDALYDIFSLFEIANSAEDIYTDDYEVERTELQRLRQILTDKGETFHENETELNACLAKMGKTFDEFIEVLDRLINDSDQNNESVFISWF